MVLEKGRVEEARRSEVDVAWNVRPGAARKGDRESSY